ncbi:MAG: response regulator [Limisphaerales bacterium]
MTALPSQPESTNPPAAQPGDAGVGPVQVWIVDDHDRLRGLIAESLRRHGGIVCTREFDGPNALLSALASRIGPDVILLDVQMGDGNGLDALPAIRSLARDTRVLMLTTCYDQEWHRRALDSGASDYLLKTYPIERLVESIRTCRQREPAPRRAPKRAVRNRGGHDTGIVGAPAGPSAPTSEPANGETSPFLRWLKSFSRN